MRKQIVLSSLFLIPSLLLNLAQATNLYNLEECPIPIPSMHQNEASMHQNEASMHQNERWSNKSTARKRESEQQGGRIKSRL